MSIPASLREGPRTTNTLAKKSYIIIYLLLMTIGAQPAVIWFHIYWNLYYGLGIIFYIVFPLAFILAVIILIIFSTLVAKFILMVISLFNKPKQGVFIFNKHDRNYRYWSLRAVIKKFPIWLTRQLFIPFFEKLLHRIFGNKIAFSASLHDCWIDSEFITIGKNTRIGQGSILMSNIIIGNKIIIKEIIVGENVIIGPHTLILPGTVIGDNAIVDCNSITTINQHLHNNELYSGKPATSLLKNYENYNINSLQTQIFERNDNQIDEESFLRAHVKELAVPFHFYIISGSIIIGFSFILPGLLFYFYLFEVLVPCFFTYSITLNTFFQPIYITFSMLTPIVLIGIYLLHLFFVVLFTKYFYHISNKRGPSQGIYDRNLDTSSKALDYYHFTSFLMKYPIFAISRSPFPWLLNWELNFLKSNKIEKGTVLEETFLHSHINFGKNCYLGTSSHITNHLVNGVYGDENLTFIGVNIGNNVILNPITGGLPGTEVGDNSTLLPGCTTLKYDKLNGNGIYNGFPVRKIEKGDLKQFLGGLNIDE